MNERYIGPIGAYNKVCLWLCLSNFKLAAYSTLSIDLVILQPRIKPLQDLVHPAIIVNYARTFVLGRFYLYAAN